MKALLGSLGVLLVCLAYLPYIFNILRGKTKPHVYSWLTWGLITALAFGLQRSEQAGPGSFVTLAGAAFSFIVFGLALRLKQKDITKIDTLFFGLTLAAIVLWLYAKQPLLSVILASSIDALSFVPTVRKSWGKPRTETITLYEISMARYGLSLVALEHYTLVTVLFPLTNIMTDFGLTLLLIFRRKRLKP